jgi:citrate synthase
MGSAIGSLKGIKHGGANIKVMKMVDDIKANCPHWDNAEALAEYLSRIVRKETFDRQGLIYGMGHAVYTLSDPRAELLKAKAKELAAEKGLMKNFELYENIEKLTPDVMYQVKGHTKALCANVDLYSGFVYEMLNIPRELYTPIFAMARVAGWSAHRIEEIVSGGKIIRPAYKNVSEKYEYVEVEARGN